MKYHGILLLLIISVLISSCFSATTETVNETPEQRVEENTATENEKQASISSNGTGEQEHAEEHSFPTSAEEEKLPAEVTDPSGPMEFLSPFDQHITQAKVHYVDALIAREEEDSLEVEFQLSIIFDLLAKIESYNTMDEIQYEQFTEFTDKIVRDFEQYTSQIRELHEKFTLSDLHEAMKKLTDDHFAGKNDYEVLEDRDGHVPIIINERVADAIKMFRTKRRGDLQQWIRTKAKYERLFRKILRENGVPEEFIYLSMLESEMKTDATSYVGAAGQWQFMDYTSKSFGLKYDYWVDERRDPVKSTEAAAKYLLYLYEEFQDWYLVMAAYNAGEGRVGRSIRYEHTRNYWEMRTLPRATRKYVPYIMAVAAISIQPERYGFRNYKPQQIWGGDFDTLTLKQSYELEKIARVCGISFEELREINPELRKFNTPAYDYTINLPKGKRSVLAREINALEASPTHVVYIVRAGDTLSDIALRYGVRVDDIVRANKLRSRSWIRVGQKLILPQTGSTYLTSGSVHSSSSSSGTGKPDLSASHRKIIYEVKRGDTLGEIAEIYDTRASRIRVWNGLVYGEHIYPKQRLNIWIPKGSSYETLKQYHTVKSGDSFEKIARQYGISPDELKKLNPRMNYSKIYPGDKIRIQ
ncbi:MAG: LysM peptidoglycan-binding domain-containing protein [Candidatus Marinimicrobia bacterium]|nr:LysM peptidoglycan-binding domain-containing protein [Candidatus Neomarinimicrobiota bacterium]